MGLDIYFHLTNADVNNKTYEEVDEADTKDYTSRFLEAYNKFAKSVEKAKDYDTTYTKGIEKLMKWFNYPQYALKDLGLSYDYTSNVYNKEVKDLETVKKVKDEVIEHVYPKYDAYFRKVNFLVKFFESFGEMDENTTFSTVTKDNIEQLIDYCDQVLKDHSLGEDLLPTCDGFFFGSTEYDDYYYDDVKDVKKQMKAFLKKMEKDNLNAYVVFSW